MTFFRLLHLQRSTYIIVFNFLIHCIIDRINSTNMNDLKIGCDVIHRPKGVAQDVQINNLPNECTSLILCLGDFDSYDTLKTFLQTSPTKPSFLIDDTYLSDQWINYFSQDNYDVNKYVNYIVNLKFSGLIFGGLYSLDCPPSDVIFDNLSAFFDKIKRLCKQKDIVPMLGVVIPGGTSSIISQFNYIKVNPIADMYLVNSVIYTGLCKDGQPLSPVDYVQYLTNSFCEPPINSLNRSKIIFGVQLYVQYLQENQKFSYGEACTRCPNSDAKFCKDSLEAMYQKGKTIHNGNFGGIYIRFVNDDDIYGYCNCSQGDKFPGFKAYISGFNGQDIPNGYNECDTYGVAGTLKINNKCVPNPTQ